MYIFTDPYYTQLTQPAPCKPTAGCVIAVLSVAMCWSEYQ